MSICARRASIRITIGLLVMMLAGCGNGGGGDGGGGGSGGGTGGGGDGIPADAPAVALSGDGQLRISTSLADDLAANRLVFRRIVANGTAYYLSVTEVTRGQWTALVAGSVVPATPWTQVDPAATFAHGSGDLMPAYGVSWTMAQQLCSVFNSRSSYDIRLPTGQEWQNACLVGGDGPYPWGSSESPTTVTACAVVRMTIGGIDGAQPVGTRSANGNGMMDMAGNVWELLADDAGAAGRVVAGGSWADNLSTVQGSNRNHLPASAAHGLVGVRLVLVRP